MGKSAGSDDSPTKTVSHRLATGRMICLVGLSIRMGLVGYRFQWVAVVVIEQPLRRILTCWPAAEFEMGGERAWYVPGVLGTRDWGNLVGRPVMEVMLEWPTHAGLLPALLLYS